MNTVIVLLFISCIGGTPLDGSLPALGSSHHYSGFEDYPRQRDFDGVKLSLPCEGNSEEVNWKIFHSQRWWEVWSSPEFSPLVWKFKLSILSNTDSIHGNCQRQETSFNCRWIEQPHEKRFLERRTVHTSENCQFSCSISYLPYYRTGGLHTFQVRRRIGHEEKEREQKGN